MQTAAGQDEKDMCLSGRDARSDEHSRVLSQPLQTYVFIRENQFYLIELHGDEDARANAECNPGTVRVESMLGRQVWPVPAEGRAALSSTEE